MNYQILYRASVKRDMRRLDAPTAQRVDAAILALADDPRPAGCKKLAGKNDLWRLRVGAHRIVYQIQDDRLIVLVVRVAHRQDVYRGL